jgi:hypothetical protein
MWIGECCLSGSILRFRSLRRFYVFRLTEALLSYDVRTLE